MMNSTKNIVLGGMEHINYRYSSGEKVLCNFSIYSSSNKFWRKLLPIKFKLLSYKLSLIESNGNENRTLMSVHGIDGIGDQKYDRIDNRLKLIIPNHDFMVCFYYFVKLEVTIEVNGRKKDIFRYKRVRVDHGLVIGPTGLTRTRLQRRRI